MLKELLSEFRFDNNTSKVESFYLEPCVTLWAGGNPFLRDNNVIVFLHFVYNHSTYMEIS